MIRLAYSLPETRRLSAEDVKLRCLFDCYKQDERVLFWVQDSDRAVISMTDGNMIILNNGADLTELKEFVEAMNPVCIFSDSKTLETLGKLPPENINIMYRKADITEEYVSDTLSSRQLYELLDTKGLSLPEYPYFAVDFCRRLNHGGAKYFALLGKCACITFNSGKKAIINGLASHQKGYGTIALKAVLNKNYGSDFLVCCRDSVMGFYQKNGFEKLYNAGYWVKNK